MQAVKCTLRYLKGTTYIQLVYHGVKSCALDGYSNVDYVGNFDARKSVTRYAFTIGNFLVSWMAILQPPVTLSTIEAEYMALADATKEEI